MALFPASSTFEASVNPLPPTPETSKVGKSGAPTLRILAPKVLKQRTVLEQSPPGEKFTISASPEAMLLRITARCEMDLSPGGVISPSRRWQGLMILILPCSAILASVC